MPRLPVPKAMKEARGTDQPCRELPNVVDLPVSRECPKAPSYLRKVGREYWTHHGQLLLNGRAMTEGDWAALGILAKLHERIVGAFRKNEDVPASTLSQYRQLLGEFGLTPSSRSRVPRAEAENTNRFARNGQKTQTGN